MDDLPDIQDDNFEHQQPLVNVKRKRVVKFCDQEILLVLRNYQTYPCAWVQIHKSMIDNIHQLPLETQNLYNSSNAKQIKDRLSTKLSKLLSVSDLDIKNITIRNELKKVRDIEIKLAQPVHKKQTGVRATTDLNELDVRSQMMQDLSSSEEDLNEANSDSSTPAPSKSASLTGPSTSTSSSLPGRSKSSSVPGSSRFSSTPGTSRPSPSQKGVRKRPLLSVMRENQEAYNIFITKKVPKLLKALGVDSDESD